MLRLNVGLGRRSATRFAAALVLVGTACLVTPTRAGATISGAGFFTGAINLQLFPCYNGGCTGAVSGTAGLFLSGLGTSTIDGLPIPYTAAWVWSESTLSGAFNYQDTCELGQPDGTVPLSGIGNGNFTLSGGSIALGGGTLTGATLSGGLNITRIGSALRVTLNNLSITPPSGSPALAVALSGQAITGQTADALVWTNGPGTCGGVSNQVSGQTADIAGVALLPV